jgi:hypothetical protein
VFINQHLPVELVLLAFLLEKNEKSIEVERVCPALSLYDSFVGSRRYARIESRVERDLERFKEFIENPVKKPGPGEELFGNKLFI